MTAEQLNLILFWTIIAILGLSAWLWYSAQKFGAQLAKDAKKEKSAKSAQKAKMSPES